MAHPVPDIVAYTFHEGLRNRLFGLTVIGLICLLGLAEFIGDLAITETHETQAAIIGTVMRLFTLVTVALFVITSMNREIHDKGLELILAMPLTRATYYFGKFFGYYGLATVIIFLTGMLLLLYAPATGLLAWMFSLWCEAGIIIALSMLCLFTLNNITLTFIVVVAFYVLSRGVNAILLISSSPILEDQGAGQEFLQALITLIAHVLPDMDLYTRSEWLVYGPVWSDLSAVIVQTLIYLPLLAAAGLFDLYRKDL